MIFLLQNEIPFEASFYAAKVAKQRGAKVVFDPAPATNISMEIIRFVDYLTPNELELVELSKEWFGKVLDPSEFYLKLSEENPNIRLIAKLGEKGAKLFAKDTEIEVTAVPVKAVDTTAAGDVFNGSFATFLSEGKSEGDALRLANIAAAISVTRYGAQTSIPSREELLTFAETLTSVPS